MVKIINETFSECLFSKFQLFLISFFKELNHISAIPFNRRGITMHFSRSDNLISSEYDLKYLNHFSHEKGVPPENCSGLKAETSPCFLTFSITACVINPI